MPSCNIKGEKPFLRKWCVFDDGTFQGKRIPGDGKTTELLKKHGIQVAGESDFMTREAFL